MEYKFFPCLHNFVEGIKTICQVYTFINQEGLVMTRLKELGQSGNYVLWNSAWPWLWISSQRGGVFWNYFVVTLFNQSNACLKLRDGDQAEFLSRRLEQYEHVSTPKGNMSSQRGNRTWHWAAYERAKAVVSAGFREALIQNAQSLFTLF